MRKDRKIGWYLTGIALGVGACLVPLKNEPQTTPEPIPTIPADEAGIRCTVNATPVQGEGEDALGKLRGIENGSVCVFESER